MSSLAWLYISRARAVNRSVDVKKGNTEGEI